MIGIRFSRQQQLPQAPISGRLIGSNRCQAEGIIGRGPSPVLAQVAALLRTPQSAGVAFVLREILDKPLCQRGRR